MYVDPDMVDADGWGTCLQDPVGGGASHFDTRVKIVVTLGASQYLDKTLLDQRRIMLEDLYQRFGFVWREFLRDTPGVWPNEPEHMVLVFPMLSILADEVVVSLREKDEYSEPLMKIFQDLLLMTKDWIPVCLRRIGEATENPFYQLFSVLILESLEREYELFQDA